MAGTPADPGLLRDLDLFRDLDEAAIAELEEALTWLELAAGEVLIRQGDKADCLYIVLHGRLSVSLARDAERAEPVAEIGPGGVAGEIALLTGGPRSATVAATEPTGLVRLSREALDAWLASHPEQLASVVDGIRRRLDLIQLAVHLGRLLGTAHRDVLREFEDEVEWVYLRSGETLFEQDAAGDSAFIVISGRLRILVRSGETETVVNEVGPGEIVGEMALLDGSSRSATVHAVRDSQLARLSARAFERLTEKHPLAIKRIATDVVARLRAQLAGETTPDSAIATIALIAAAPDLPISELSSALASALSVHGSTRALSSAGVDLALSKRGIANASAREPAGIRLAQWLAEQEAENRYVLYEADAHPTGWTERAIGQADHVLIFADAEAPPEPGALERQLARRWPEGRAPRRSLVLIHRDPDREPKGTARWLEKRSVDAHYHLNPNSQADFERLARILAGRAIGLVFGGGGARGFAHLGVWQALEELNVPVDFVGGTSIGAIVAAAFAMRISARRAIETAKKRFSSVLDPTLPLVALLSGARISSQITSFFGEREIEDLPLPFFCIATNLTTSAETVHRSGSVATATRSSVSIPGVLPPVAHHGDLLVDGGLLNNVPVDVMKGLVRGGPVIAVDVTPKLDLRQFDNLPQVLSGWSLLWDRVNPLRAAPDVPYIVNVLTRSTVVASAAAKRESAGEGGLYLRPPVDDWGMFEFRSVEAIAERGCQTSLGAISEWWQRRRRADQAARSR